MLKIEDIIKAKSNFDPNIIKETPLDYNEYLSSKFKSNVWLKREDLQIVRSYKIRWAYNFISSLSEKEKQKWVVAASAGNHAQWVAMVCNHLKIKWTIFMPKTTPDQKIRKTKKFGWEYIDIVLEWDTFDDAYKSAVDFVNKTWAIFVHPFDDYKIIAGQWTIGLEILEQLGSKKPDYILIPIGWWWLISWISFFVKNISPNTKIIWVEPEWSPDFYLSFKNWKIIELDKIDVFADGVAVKKPGIKTFEIVKKYVDDIVIVPEWLISKYLLEMIDDQWIILEPAGVLSVAWLENIKDKIKWKNVVCILSGWNFDLDRLPLVKERALRYEWKKRYFIINFPQRPWALREFLSYLWKNDDIVFFEYIKKHSKEKWPAVVGIQSKSKQDIEKLIENFKKHNVDFKDITFDDTFYSLLVL